MMRIPGTLLLLLLPAPIVVVVAASFTPDGYLRFPPGAMSLLSGSSPSRQ